MKFHFLAVPAALMAQLLLNSISPAWATSFVPRPLPSTTQSTANIVRGKVGQSRGDWGTALDGTKRLFTYYDLQVSEGLKGEIQTGSNIQFRELGGEKDGIGMQVAGAAVFKPGEDVVVMLSEKNSDGSYDLRGLMTGKFNITHDASGREILVGATGDEDASDAASKHGPWTMDEFRKLIASQSSARKNEMPSPRPSASIASGPPSAALASPAPLSMAPSAAPQLQSDRDQGAPGASGFGFSWGYVMAGLLIGAAAIMALRKRN